MDFCLDINITWHVRCIVYYDGLEPKLQRSTCDLLGECIIQCIDGKLFRIQDVKILPFSPSKCFSASFGPEVKECVLEFTCQSPCEPNKMNIILLVENIRGVSIEKVIVSSPQLLCF